MNAPALATAPGIPADMAGFAVTAANMQEAFKLCEWIAQSPLIPKAYRNNPQAVWTAGAMGQRLGIDLFTAMTGIADINGRPSIWGDLLRALILRHPELEAIDDHMEGEGESRVAVCIITRKGFSPYEARFDYETAKRAKLLEKDTYKNYIDDMLAARAFARAARRRFADAMCGLSAAEEMQDAVVLKDAELADPPSANPEPRRRRLAGGAPGEPTSPAEDQAAAATGDDQVEAGEAPLTYDDIKALANEVMGPQKKGLDKLKELLVDLGAYAEKDGQKKPDAKLLDEEQYPEAARRMRELIAAQKSGIPS